MAKMVARLEEPQRGARETLTLLGTVDLEVKPYGTLIYQTAKTRAIRKAHDLKSAQQEQIDAFGDAGADFGEIGDLRDPDRFGGLISTLILQELAVEAVTGWDGVAPKGSDDPAPVTDENVRTFMRLYPSFASAFERQYQEKRLEIVSEGEGCGTSANTTSSEAGVPNTAEDAEKPTAKPARPAPTKRGSRRPASGKSPGKSSGKARATS